jgi:hypothetical protein
MAKYLKLRIVDLEPETLQALEYESPMYLSYSHVTEIPNVAWESEPMTVEPLLAFLGKRGWHPTDIADELDEARTPEGQRPNNSFKPNPLRGFKTPSGF